MGRKLTQAGMPVLRLLILGCFWGVTMLADDPVVCPKASKEAHETCRAIAYKDLPAGARTLLRKLKCDVRAGGPYDFGSAVDLNGDGSLEYQFCCHEAPHGPCSAVLIGKVGSAWKDLTAKGGLLGFEGACSRFTVLETSQNGYHDVCLPIQCATPATPGSCVPAIWRYSGDRYRLAK